MTLTLRLRARRRLAPDGASQIYQSPWKRDPGTAFKRDPHRRLRSGLVPGVHGGDPRPARRALTSDGAARVGRRCGPPRSIREARTERSGAVFEAPALVSGFENVAVMGNTRLVRLPKLLGTWTVKCIIALISVSRSED